METLLYIALFGLILSGIVVSAYPLITGSNNLSDHLTAQGETSFVLRKIALELASGVTSVDTPTEDGFLVLRIFNSGPAATRFRVNSGEIQISKVAAGTTYDPLTASRVNFSNFSVNDVELSEGPNYVEIEFDAGGEHVGPARLYYYD